VHHSPSNLKQFWVSKCPTVMITRYSYRMDRRVE